MDTKPAALWFPSILILGIPTLVTIMVRVQTGSDLFMLIPWVTAPIIGFWIAWIWNKRRRLPPAPPAYTPSPLLVDGSFDLSGEQFFPLRPDYSEPPPSPPAGPKLTLSFSFSIAAMIFACLGIIIPFFLTWSSILAVFLAFFNPAIFTGNKEALSMPIRRLTVLAFCLGLSGIWSSALTLFLILCS